MLAWPSEGWVKNLQCKSPQLQPKDLHNPTPKTNCTVFMFSTCNSCLVLPLHIVEKLLEVVAVVAHPQAISIALKQSGLVDFSQYSSSSHFYCFALKQSNRYLSGMLPTFLQTRSTWTHLFLSNLLELDLDWSALKPPLNQNHTRLGDKSIFTQTTTSWSISTWRNVCEKMPSKIFSVNCSNKHNGRLLGSFG